MGALELTLNACENTRKKFLELFSMNLIKNINGTIDQEEINYFSTIFAFISKFLHMEATPPIRLGRVILVILTTTPSSSSSIIFLFVVSLEKSSSPYFSIKSFRSNVFLLEVGVAATSESDSELKCKLTLGLTFLSSFLNK